MTMTLRKVDKADYRFLYNLLLERPISHCISHRKNPSFRKHCTFVRSKPYRFWYVLVEQSGLGDETCMGAIYLTKKDEIGIHILPEYRSQGRGREAVMTLMKRHPRPRFYANIAPTNPESAWFFNQLGFRCRQHTYELSPGAVA